MDDLHSYLVNEHQRATISPESLEMMGKEAANLLLNEGVSLNESIAKLAGTHSDINHEHVKRICEFANNSVYLAKHDQNKTAGASSSYPRFVLADPNRVVQDLSDGARPTVFTPTDTDYGRQPLKKEKMSSAMADAYLAQLFSVETEEPFQEFSKESGVEDVMGAKSSLIALRDNLSNTGEQFDLLQKEASEAYYASVKHHLLDGGGFEDVMNASHHTGADGPEIAAVLQPVVVRLLKEKVSSVAALKQGMAQMTKVAHRVINPEHPFVSTLATVISFDREIEKIATGLQEVEEQLAVVNSFIQEQCRAESSR